jgi:3-isopropylmalate/(R)-2-methylmalate dehydratase small subunit
MDDASRGAIRYAQHRPGGAGDPRPDGGVVRFEVDAFKKHCLLNGLDGIGLTLEKAPSIDAFESRNHAERPWA